MKLTPTQWAVLEHRLELDDCLGDCLSDNHDDQSKWSYDVVAGEASSLYVQINKTRELDFASLTELQKAIIVDCLEGSTFFCSADDEVRIGRLSRSKLARWHKAADGLEDLVSTPERRVNCQRA